MKKLLALLLSLFALPAYGMNGNPPTLPTAVSGATYTVLTSVQKIDADPTSNAIAITMFANPANGANLEICDATNKAATNNITITPGATPASTTVNGGSSLVMNVNGQCVKLTYNFTQNNWGGALSNPSALASGSVYVGNASGLAAPLAVFNSANLLLHGCTFYDATPTGVLTNTGLGTNAEYNNASVALPVLGAHDLVGIYQLWLRSGTGGDTVTFTTRLAAASCTPQQTCSAGTTIKTNSTTITTAATFNDLTFFKNNNATNAQVAFTNSASASFNQSSATINAPAIQTNSTPFINFDSNTVTSSGDSAVLEAAGILVCKP